MNPLRTLVLALFLPMLGCITTAGDQLTSIAPSAPSSPPSIEQTVGDFSFHLDGGKMVTSNKMGRSLNDEVFNRWKKAGFIQSHKYVKSSNFTGQADYNVTLSGHQEGDSSVVMQFLSGLTLFVLPYSVGTQMDLAYTVEHVPTGRQYQAEVSDHFGTVTSLLLLPVAPFFQGGRTRTYQRIADHVFQQLEDQGAFSPEPPPEAAPSEP